MDAEAETQAVWKIFIPHDLLVQSDAFLFGHVIADAQSLCISASSSHAHIVNNGIPGLAYVGVWSKKGIGRKHEPGNRTSVWLDLRCSKQIDIKCRLLVKNRDVPCTCVVFNPVEFLKSSVIAQRCCLQDTQKEEVTDNVSAVVSTVRKTQTCIQGLDSSLVSEVTTYSGKRSPGGQHVMTSVEWLLSLMTVLYIPFHWLLSPRLTRNSNSRRVLQTPTVIGQLKGRTRDLHNVRLTPDLLPLQRIRHMDCLCRQGLDTVLGICLMFYLMKDDTAGYVVQASIHRADLLVAELKDLLHWLMGAPAGLKLNSQLTHFLGNFFLYHIHLWTGFLYLVRPVLGNLLYYSCSCGVFGLTVQIALFQDIFSTLTIHIYCFYVYAARLYKLQVYVLGSLWRLFRGKKWNVLRQRVDSAAYDADQLFLGTLLFTVLLFLLPTTGLYYIVFALLRLILLFIQSFLGKLRQWLNSLPVWSVCLWVFRSAAFTDGAVFQVKEDQRTANCLLLSMQSLRLGLTEVLDLSRVRDQETNTGFMQFLGRVLKDLVKGDLIYPWIDKSRKS